MEEELLKQLEGMKKMGMDITQDPEIVELFAALQGFKDIETTSVNDYKLDIKFINKSENEDPEYASEGASGFDLRANIEESITLKFGERSLIPTGLHFDLPDGYDIAVCSRSGLALKNGVMVLNSPGVVDSDYKGDLGVILINLGQEPFTVTKGDRVAQAVIRSVTTNSFVTLNKVDKLKTNSNRGNNGFGSTGVG